MKRINWVQKLEFPDGTVTPGVWDNLLQDVTIDFSKKRVLDIGCLNGQYTFYAEKHGAKEVVSIDLIEDTKNKQSYPQTAYTNEGYLYAHNVFNSKAKYVFPYSIYDVTPKDFGQFDIVLFLGVIYHLAHPLVALERINTVLKKDGLMVLESEISKSATRFYNKLHLKHNPAVQSKSVSLKSQIKNKALSAIGKVGEDKNEVFNKDSSVFWVPSKKDLIKFIDYVGFAVEQTIEDPRTNRVTYLCRKKEEVNQTYAVTSYYTNLKKRTSNFKGFTK